MNPCGVIFGVLRSAYTTKARLVQGSDRQSTVRWYKAPDGAQFFQGRHCMQPLSWTGGSTAPNPQGEIIGEPRPWNNGSTPTCAEGAGVWGDPKWFADGVPEVLSTPWTPNACGLPTSCPVLCQPFYTTNLAGRKIERIDSGVTLWPLTANSTTGFQAADPTQPLRLVIAQQLPDLCLDGPHKLRIAWQSFFPPTFAGFPKLISYDPTTHSGVWKAQAAPAPYNSYVFRITCPP